MLRSEELLPNLLKTRKLSSVKLISKRTHMCGMSLNRQQSLKVVIRGVLCSGVAVAGNSSFSADFSPSLVVLIGYLTCTQSLAARGSDFGCCWQRLHGFCSTFIFAWYACCRSQQPPC